MDFDSFNAEKSSENTDLLSDVDVNSTDDDMFSAFQEPRVTMDTPPDGDADDDIPKTDTFDLIPTDKKKVASGIIDFVTVSIAEIISMFTAQKSTRYQPSADAKNNMSTALEAMLPDEAKGVSPTLVLIITIVLAYGSIFKLAKNDYIEKKKREDEEFEKQEIKKTEIETYDLNENEAFINSK